MERIHPIVIFVYFCVVIGCSMFLIHPVCLVISMLGAFCYVLLLFGFKKAKKGLLGMLGIMLLTAVMNPAFSHQGVTTLMYLPSGNVLTLESIYYGMAAALMLASSVLWFRCMSEILTSDKIVYLFGKSFPILGLLLSMILGFIPKLQRKFEEIKRYRGQHIIENLSILVTWALDDAADVADNMKARGYGLEGRTAFTIYRFTKRDGIRLLFILFSLLYIVLGSVNGGLVWTYYPETTGSGFGWYPLSIYMVYALLCSFPIIVSYFTK